MAKIITVLLGATALCAASAAAASIVDFTNPPGDVGSATHTYADGGGLSVVATGYDESGGAATNLYGKNAGTGEIGLGLTSPTKTRTTGDPSGQNEIYKGAFVQLDVSDLIGKVSSAMFAMNSTTQKETWAIYGSNTDGSYSGFALLTGMDQSNHDLVSLGLNTNNFKFYDFVSLGTAGREGFSAGNVLLGNITLVRSVPEPATWAMMLLGFGAIGVSVRRRKNVAIAQVA